MAVLRGPDGQLYGIGTEVVRISTRGTSERPVAKASQRSAARIALDDTAAFFCGYRNS
jgi:hypothetical protein